MRIIKSVGKTNGYQTNNMIHANKRPPKTINQNTKRNTILYSHIEKKIYMNPQETTQKKERKRKQRNLPSGLCWNNGLEAIFDTNTQTQYPKSDTLSISNQEKDERKPHENSIRKRS